MDIFKEGDKVRIKPKSRFELESWAWVEKNRDEYIALADSETEVEAVYTLDGEENIYFTPISDLPFYGSMLELIK